MPETLERLKPCPFCGADALIKRLSGRYAIECTRHCVGTRILPNREQVIEIWNRRTTP